MKNSEVRQAVFDIERFWLDKGVDGFKTDFINLISKPVSYQTFQEEHPSQERIKTFINEEVRNKNHWAKSANVSDLGVKQYKITDKNIKIIADNFMLLIEGMNVLALTGKLTEKQIDDQFTLFVKTSCK